MNSYTYEESLQASIEYFYGNELAAKVWLDKYALRDNNNNILEKTPDDTHKRLAKEFARIEQNKFKKPLSENEIYELFKGYNYISCQGGPTFAIGNPYQYVSSSNCVVLPPPVDSYGGIHQSDEELTALSKRRSGVGFDISTLRPEGTPTTNSSRTSTGIIPFLERYSNSTREVGQCIARGQKVLTARGLLPIEQVLIGDEVWTKEGWIKVINVFNNGIKSVYKTTTRFGYSIATSKDHLFSTSDDGFLVEKRLNQLNIGDTVTLIPGKQKYKEYVTLQDFQYQRKEYSNKSNRLQEFFLPEILHEDFAYYIGYTFGNGYVVYKDGEPVTLEVSCDNKWKNIQTKIISILTKYFNKTSVEAGGGNCSIISIHSKQICAWLQHNNLLKQKADSLIIPDIIFESPISVQLAFYAGLFDADGYAQKTKSGYRLSSICLDMLKNIQQLLMINGIASKIHKEDRTYLRWNDLYTLTVVGKQFQTRLIEKISESIKIQDCSRIASVDFWRTPYKPKGLGIKPQNYNYIADNSQYISSSGFLRLKNDDNVNLHELLITDTIKSIEYIGEKETFDLELESEHLFYCEGFYVHNSSRRGALMQSLSVHHPEVEKFATIKRDLTKVTGANISVRLTDEFLNAVENDEEYEQRWPVDSNTPKISRKISAKKVWNTIIENAHYMAEPGLQFWDNIINESIPANYKGWLETASNPCSEIVMQGYETCRLMIINTFSYVVNPFTSKAYFDFSKFYEHAQIAQRLMDDLIDLEIECIDRILTKVYSDPEPESVKFREINLWKRIRENCLNGRRTGLGPTAIGDAVAAMGFAYDSEKGIELIDAIYKTLKLGSYRSSCDMAKELGPFPIWDWDTEKNARFLLRIKDEDEQLYSDIGTYGRRNIANLTTAPVGSLSIVSGPPQYAGTTSGIECLPYMASIRRKKINHNDSNSRTDFVDQNGDHWQEFTVYHSKIKMWMDITGETDVTKSPYYGSCCEDIDYDKGVELQARAQKHVDHAISRTVNLPENVSVEEVARIYEKAWKLGCKGITVYRKNCRTGVILDASEPSQTSKNAPKRPKSLPCDVHHVKVGGKPYYAVIGFLEGRPYEVFTGENLVIPQKIHMGEVVKTSRSSYNLVAEHGDFSLTNKHDDSNSAALCRLISTSLRHGIPLEYIVHQLEKVHGDMQAYAKVVCRVIKKYIKDGIKVSGEECPDCGSNLIRQEGCVRCSSCSFSRCS